MVRDLSLEKIEVRQCYGRTRRMDNAGVSISTWPQGPDLARGKRSVRGFCEEEIYGAGITALASAE
jgi:hypothetical protein